MIAFFTVTFGLIFVLALVGPLFFFKRDQFEDLIVGLDLEQLRAIKDKLLAQYIIYEAQYHNHDIAYGAFRKQATLLVSKYLMVTRLIYKRPFIGEKHRDKSGF